MPYPENAADAEYLSAHISIYHDDQEDLNLHLGYSHYTDEDEFYCGANITLLSREYSDHGSDDQDPEYWGIV